VRTYIESEFRQAGIKPYKGTYRHEFTHVDMVLRTDGCNLVGIIEGSDSILKHEFIVLGAHYDHVGWKTKNEKKVIYPGADDNASGVATIIEIGKNLVAKGNAIKRSIIIVAFDGEESGLWGSEMFVRNKVVEPEKIVVMYSVDMVGMYSKVRGVELVGAHLLKNQTETIKAIANSNSIHINKINSYIESRTDTKSFGVAGIPAIYVSTGLKSPYHKPEDKSNLLDYNGMALICNFITDLTAEFAKQQTIVPSAKLAKIKSGKRLLKAGLSLNIGKSFFNYKDLNINGKQVLGIQTGFYCYLPLAKKMVLQPQILFELGGSMDTLYKVSTQSITTPLNIMFPLITISDLIDCYVLIGGYYSYNFAGKAGSKKIDFTNNFKRDDYGINWGFGFDVKKIQLGFLAKYGLTDQNLSTSRTKILNRGVYMTLCYQL